MLASTWSPGERMPASMLLRAVIRSTARGDRLIGALPGRAGEALLQAGGHGIQPPRIEQELIAGERRRDVGVEQHVVLHGRSRPSSSSGCATVVDVSPCTTARSFGRTVDDGLLDALDREDRAPLRLDHVHVGPAALGDLAQQMAEPTEDRARARGRPAR